MARRLNLGFLLDDRERGDKVLNDPIHGHITVKSSILEFIDTPQFQRLRDLKQLGTSYFVFPGATHNRFEHCIGVSYLAGKYMEKFHLQKGLIFDVRDIQLVSIAGLCHDIGHGPFSHAFETWVHRRDKSWRHENMSVSMINYLMEENGIIDSYTKSEKDFIIELILGSSSASPSNLREKGWMYDIVSNSRNSVDVDKFDYLARDAYHTGTKATFDHERIMTNSCIIDNQICYSHKDAFPLYQLFHTRFTNFKQIYSHRVSKAIEYMIADAFDFANEALGLSECLNNPESYTTLNDTILCQIERSKDPRLTEAKALVKNIRCRNLYKYVCEFIVPKDQWENLNPEVVTSANIVTAGSNLQEEDIIVDIYTLNYALKDKNPVDNIRFYRTKGDLVPFNVKREEVSNLIPTEFSEKCIRIFVKNPAHCTEAYKAFCSFLESRGVKPDVNSKNNNHHSNNNNNNNNNDDGIIVKE